MKIGAQQGPGGRHPEQAQGPACPAHCLLGFGGPSADWAKLKADIVALCDDESNPNPSVDAADGSMGGGGYIAPMLVRLAWHSSGSYAKSPCTGGSVSPPSPSCGSCHSSSKAHLPCM